MSRRALLAGVAAAVGVAAALTAGYAAAGPAGLVDAATVAAAGVLVVARAVWPGQEPRSVRTTRRRNKVRAPAISAAEFPAYRTITADLSWALTGGHRVERGLRRTLTQLAAALGRPDPLAADPAVRPGADGPGLDLPTLDRIVSRLEKDR
ncbi:MAG TPA: hypothetical protein VMK84_01390 [Streptosporangiaceae bacterium]|nr:hypothetical protein [Streptosporangiaceae bacterium]